MARRPKYGRVIPPITFRPSPENEEKLNRALKQTGQTVSEIADEVLSLGFSLYPFKRPPKEKRQPAASA